MSDETLKLPGLPRGNIEIPGYGVPIGHTDEAMRELQRQTVEVCAKVCEDLIPKNEHSDWTEYAHIKAKALTDAMNALRDLLKD